MDQISNWHVSDPILIALDMEKIDSDSRNVFNGVGIYKDADVVFADDVVDDFTKDINLIRGKYNEPVQYVLIYNVHEPDNRKDDKL